MSYTKPNSKKDLDIYQKKIFIKGHIAKVSAGIQVKTYWECQGVSKSGQACSEEKKRVEWRERDKRMDGEKWVQLVPFVALVHGPRSSSTTGRVEKAPVMTC